MGKWVTRKVFELKDKTGNKTEWEGGGEHLKGGQSATKNAFKDIFCMCNDEDMDQREARHHEKLDKRLEKDYVNLENEAQKLILDMTE